MKIVVTGSNGRLGRRVTVAALKEGHSVHGIDSALHEEEPEYFRDDRFKFSAVDLRDYDKTLEALRGSDAVIQLAAIPTPTDYVVEAHNTNVVISWNVLRAAAELGITRVALASSVNVVRLVWSQEPLLYYLPIDEDHPREPDEPYGLSKLILETQADTIVRRWPKMRIASLRPSWAIPSVAYANEMDSNTERRKNDLWGWVHEDSVADAFIHAVAFDGSWKAGHEAFFIVAPDNTESVDPQVLYEKYWGHVPVKEGKDLSRGFFDCSKAERLLGWVHRVPEQ